jgi:ankyrin repeat protein
MSAASRGMPDVVRELLAVGADPDTKNRANWNALFAAVQSGSEEVVQSLIEGLADVDAAGPGGETVLVRALAKGDPWMIETLKSNKASTSADVEPPAPVSAEPAPPAGR